MKDIGRIFRYSTSKIPRRTAVGAKNHVSPYAVYNQEAKEKSLLLRSLGSTNGSRKITRGSAPHASYDLRSTFEKPHVYVNPIIASRSKNLMLKIQTGYAIASRLGQKHVFMIPRQQHARCTIALYTTQRDLSITKREGHSEKYASTPLIKVVGSPRQSREELLAAATGFWSRLAVRFKWFSIRSLRPFNADDISAFFSWILLGHVLWIILGTTTFFSLAILAVNTVFAQETLAQWVGNYLTRSSGVQVVFESAIVPSWRDGVITFKNVFISRRSGSEVGSVTKISKMTQNGQSSLSEIEMHTKFDEAKMNVAQFDLSLGTVNVTLSFRKWLNSKGLLRDVEIKGVRGVIDRTAIQYDVGHIDPREFRHEHQPGDFELDSFKLEDLLVTVHQPANFRPFSISIYTCELPQLRRQWLFYDFLAANAMSGSFDNSLFTIHPRQTHGIVGARQSEERGADSPRSDWKKQSKLRIDALNIYHLNRGVPGPFSWIHKGTVDIIANINFPPESDGSISKLMSDLYDKVEATMIPERHVSQPDHEIDTTSINCDLESDHHIEHERRTNSEPRLVLDMELSLNNIRAAVPLFTRDLSYVNNALIRPIVAFLNAKRASIPMHCRVVKNVSEFDGSWTIYDSGLMEDLSVEAYQAFAEDVTNEQTRMRRLRKVGLWSLQLAAQAFLMGLAGNFA